MVPGKQPPAQARISGMQPLGAGAGAGAGAGPFVPLEDAVDDWEEFVEDVDEAVDDAALLPGAGAGAGAGPFVPLEDEFPLPCEL